VKIKEFSFTINGIDYQVTVTFKSQRNIYYRFRDGQFFVTAPRLCAQSTINNGLEKFAPRMIAKANKIPAKPYSFNEKWVYLLGNRVPLEITGNSWITCDYVSLDKEENLDKVLRKFLLNVITPIVREYELKMDVRTPYRISIKNMSTRWGSNSYQTHRLHFSSSLVHFSLEIITSVVVHELSHEFYRNHQRGFYQCVLKYCPNYQELHTKLRKRIYQ